jgi:hypothetical protein
MTAVCAAEVSAVEYLACVKGSYPIQIYSVGARSGDSAWKDNYPRTKKLIRDIPRWELLHITLCINFTQAAKSPSCEHRLEYDVKPLTCTAAERPKEM